MVTVISGTWHFGYGASFDEKALKELPPGSFYKNRQREPATRPPSFKLPGSQRHALPKSNRDETTTTQNRHDMNDLTHHKITTNGLLQHYVTVGKGPIVLCMRLASESRFLPVIEGLSDRYRFIAPDLRGYADSGKPDGHEPGTVPRTCSNCSPRNASKFHILSHDLGDRLVALAYMAFDRALSLATIGGTVWIFSIRSARGLLASRDAHEHGITRFLIEGREEQYPTLFAILPTTRPPWEDEIQGYVAQMRRRKPAHGLNHYIPQMAAQTSELSKSKLTVPMLAWGGRVSFGDHCFTRRRQSQSQPKAALLSVVTGL